MKAKAKKDFEISINNKNRLVKKGDLADFFPFNGTTDESGEICIDNEYVCHNHSPFAKEHFLIIDELELVELPADPSPEEPAPKQAPDECDADRLYRLKNEGYTNLPYDDVSWLIEQAEKAKAHEKWLNKIAEIDTDAFTAVDASYWALLALGKV